MEDREDTGKPQEEIQQEKEIKEETQGKEAESLESEEEKKEEKQTQFEEVEPMEEKTQVEATEEKKSGGKGLVYLALIFAIVALVLSFWNVGVQRVVKEIESQEKVLEARTRVMETALNKVRAQTLLSQVQIEASKVYMLTMRERNYDGAARVLESIESRINSLKPYYSEKDLGELMALVDALKKEVAKGPSPIPGLVAQIQSVSDRMMGLQQVKAVTPKEEVKAVKPEAKKEVKEEAKVEQEKKEVIKQAPKEEPSAQVRQGPQAGVAPEEEGPFGGFLKSWSKLGEKLVGKKK